MPPILHGDEPIGEIVTSMATTPDRLAGLVQGIDDATMDAAPPGEWSIRTVMAHLRDDEFLVMRPRLVRMINEDEPELAPFDEQAWAETRWRGRDARDELLADFALQREASLMILRQLDDSVWLRHGSQPEIGAFDVAWWLQHWLEHDDTHLAQIANLLRES